MAHCASDLNNYLRKERQIEMKERIIYDITGEKVEVSVDRETGEIDFFDNHLKLNIQDNSASLVEIENNEEISICAGLRREENWYF